MKQKSKDVLVAAAAGIVAIGLGIWAKIDAIRAQKEWDALSDEEKQRIIKQQKVAIRQEKQRKRVSALLAGKILRRARFHCEKCGQYCGRGGRKGELTVCYIIKTYDEGKATFDNLRALCEICSRSEQKLES